MSIASGHLGVGAAQARSPIAMRFADSVLVFHAIVLLGYAVLGKGFAYLGAPPLYLGELLLLSSIVLLLNERGAIARLASPPVVLLMCLWAWCGLQTARHFGAYGIDSLRDAALFTYAAIGLAVAAACSAQPRRLLTLISRYRWFCVIFLVIAPISFCLYHFARNGLPTLPWADVPIISVKEADLLVHLGGILAFWTAGFSGRPRFIGIVALTACAAVMGVIDRAGMVAFGSVFALCFIARPGRGAAAGALLAIVLAVGVLWISGLSIEVPGGKGREISFSQIMTNLSSVAGDTGSDGLDSTKEWRLDWWKDIIGYTINGEYFWTGKGFGINLADDDGYQVNQDKSLRTPHSVHMTFLARAGVPGIALWEATQAAWAICIVRAYFNARSRGQRRWESLFFFLFCYWMAFLINASFDVYLEGPVGGIWFWTIFGVGIAAMDLHRRAPALLDQTPLTI